MMRKLILTSLAIVFDVSAQERPANTSICDFYAQASLGASNVTTQYTLLTLLVNTAVIGNYTNSSISAVPGILAQNATYNKRAVNLLPYFDGSLASSNRGGNAGKAINFLDDGGAAPLKMNKPSNGTSSNQYHLLMHLYSFFGTLLGCSDMGGTHTSFPGYGGSISMYSVHKFMALDTYQVGYFIEQVGLAAASLGVQAADVQFVGNTLQGYFGERCSPATDVLPGRGKELQAVCIADNCPMDPHPTCSAYAAVVEPKNENGSTKGSPAGTVTRSGGGGNASQTAASNVGTQLGVSVCTALMLLGVFFGTFA